MNVNQIITQFVSSVSHRIHQTRARALASCVQSAMSGQRLTVTDLGRGLHTQAFEKHAIKRADRLCSNSLLLAQLPLIYHHLCTLLVPQQSRPVIHVDWSDMNLKKTLFLIRASLSFEGRALTLYEEVHTLSTKEKAATHESFLQMLAQLLPPDVKPIIVTDAGFKRPWFKSVRARGWDFVGRIRGRVCVSPDGEKGPLCKTLFPQATTRPKCLKNWFMGNKAPYQLNLVLIGTLAHNLLILIGVMTENLGIHRRFQANTIRARKVLSYFSLGRRFYRTNTIGISSSAWKAAIMTLRQKIESAQVVLE